MAKKATAVGRAGSPYLSWPAVPLSVALAAAALAALGRAAAYLVERPRALRLVWPERGAGARAPGW